MKKSKPVKRVGQDGFRAPPNFRRMGHVYLHPQDKPSGYPPAVLQSDPNTFQPTARRDAYGDTHVYRWGLYDDASERATDMASALAALMQRMSTANSRLTYYEPIGMADPLEQFIGVLIDRKLAAIANNPEIEEACRTTSLTIKVSLLLNEEDCWRIFRVPASTSLAVLHDQILCPVMGWARGYHGYAFEDNTDGAAIGPKDNSGYIDMMHVRMHFLFLMDDRKIPLAALLRKVGDECFYTYDLGDLWRHRLKVIAVSDVEGGESVELLDGKGACPPEDSNGLGGEKGVPAYEEFLAEVKENPKSVDVKRAIREIETRAVNYTKNWLTNGPIPFKPFEYPIDLHRRMLQSTISGPRIEKPSSIWLDEFAENMNECAACKDRLRPLMMCAACNKVRYCSKECQKWDWKRHKVHCKQSQQAQKG